MANNGCSHGGEGCVISVCGVIKHICMSTVEREWLPQDTLQLQEGGSSGKDVYCFAVCTPSKWKRLHVHSAMCKTIAGL